MSILNQRCPDCGETSCGWCSCMEEDLPDPGPLTRWDWISIAALFIIPALALVIFIWG